MRRQYRTKIWQLQLPDEWKVEAAGGQEFVTFFRPDGVGMLTILTTDDSKPATAEGDKIVREPLPDEGRESNYGTSYSRTWMLRCRGRKLLVRYSCAAKNVDSERGEVDQIVRSIAESDEHDA
jgi:hypothetical protein